MLSQSDLKTSWPGGTDTPPRIALASPITLRRAPSGPTSCNVDEEADAGEERFPIDTPTVPRAVTEARGWLMTCKGRTGEVAIVGEEESGDCR